DGCIQDDRCAVRHWRKSVLHRKQRPSYIDVEDGIEMLLRNLAKRGKRRHSGVRKHDIESAFLALDLSKKPIQIREIRDISLDAGDISSDLLHCGGQFALASSCDDTESAFSNKFFCGGEADTAIATCNECNFAFKLCHEIAP